jgi:tRNA1(Val) A37 N6-methylase TrmN6
MANPPFLERGRGSPVANPAKAAATIEGDADLGGWVRFALAMVRGKGTVTFVHRADRIDALIGHLAGRAGEIAIFPLWPAWGRPAARVLVRARKHVAAPARLLPGLALHEADGRFTAAAEAVLRDGAGLEI